MKILVLSIITILSLVACNGGENIDYFDKICIDSSGFKVDSSKGSATYPTKLNDEYLSLRDISYPSDTFYLRVEYGTDSSVKIFEYSFYKCKKTYKIYSFPLEYRPNGKIMFDNKKDKLNDYTQTFNSVGRDEKFIKELEKSNILNLSYSVDIKNYPPAPYDHSHYVQFSNHCKYNIFSFGDAFKNSSKFIEAKQFSGFITYLKKEFGF